MSYWLTDHDLFLYAKGLDDVILRRCKKLASSSSSGSSLVVPMKSDDFDYVSNVENHLELIGRMSDWEEPDYKRLVKYIYEKRLLVNGQGLVIAELLHKVDKDGKKTIDDAANEEDVPAIYIRSLDVLPLNSYIPKLSERSIPLRTVKYLEDVNGKAAMMEEKDSNVTKLTARVENLEAENTRLESKNNTLDTSVTQLTTGLATITCNVVDLQSKNKTLEAENKTLDSNVKILEGKVTKLTADLVATVQQELDRMRSGKEVWMNDFSNSEWFGIERLLSGGTYNFIIINQPGTFTVEDSSTNVRARYWYRIQLWVGNSDIKNVFKAVSPEDLTPNKEKARFTPGIWFSFNSNGKTYAYRD